MLLLITVTTSILLRPAAAPWTFVTGGKHATGTLRKDDKDDDDDEDYDNDDDDKDNDEDKDDN